MMRHEAFLMSETESLEIISQVDRWCRRTGSSYNKLITAARVAPCTRSHVRMGNYRLPCATRGTECRVSRAGRIGKSASGPNTSSGFTGRTVQRPSARQEAPHDPRSLLRDLRVLQPQPAATISREEW